VRVCANRHGPRRDPCTISLLPISEDRLVTTQQLPASTRKSLTLLQLLGLIGAAGVIADIVLNLFV